MEPKYSGGCLCRGIRYEISSDPKYTLVCHCRDCQKALGGAFLPGMLFRVESVNLSQGETRGYSVTGTSGKGITRRFCGNCGSTLFLQMDAFPKSIVVMAGTLDDPTVFKPQEHLWTDSGMMWAEINDGLKRFPKARPAG